MLLDLDWTKLGKDEFYNLIYVINKIRCKIGENNFTKKINKADITTETKQLDSIFCFDSTSLEDVAEFKALVRCSKRYRSITDELESNADLLQILDIRGINGNPVFIHEAKYTSKFNNFWELIKACPSSNQDTYLKNCALINCSKSQEDLSEYVKLVRICQKLMSVPPYPNYRIIEKYAPKPKENESQDKSPRQLRADAVDSYVYTHMENSNLNDVLVKVCLVDAMYHAQLEKKANYETMAQHILDFRTGDGSTYLDALDSLNKYKWNDDAEKRKFIDLLIDYIRDVAYKNPNASKDKGVYSFATKYLHCHNKNFPIWDSNVNKIYNDWHKYYTNWNNLETEYQEIYSLDKDKQSDVKHTYYDYFLYVKNVWKSIVGNDHKDECPLDRFDAALWTLGNKVYHFTDPDSED